MTPRDRRQGSDFASLMGQSGSGSTCGRLVPVVNDPQQTSRDALRKGLADNQSQYFARLRGLSLIHAHGVVDAERAGAIGRNVKKASRRQHVLKDLGDIAGIS